MNETGTELTFGDNPDESRYEARIGPDVGAYLVYLLEPPLIRLVHTEVDRSLKGEGVGSRLVTFALDDIRARGLSIRVTCSFVGAFLERHPEYSDLVAMRREDQARGHTGS